MGSEIALLIPLLAILAFVITILWIFLPFAVFRMRKELIQLVRLQAETNRLLRSGEHE